jgi:type VI secretion system secreted protein Hcp
MSTSDIHLKLDGIKGESTDARHRDEIVVEGWTWGIAHTAPPAGSGGGGAAGRPVFSDLSFTHRVDRASPLLWKACAGGSVIRDAVLSVARNAGSSPDYLLIKLREVRVTAAALADSAADGQAPTETVSLAFARVDYEYRAQRPNGSLDAPVSFGYDLKRNRVT